MKFDFGSDVEIGPRALPQQEIWDSMLAACGWDETCGPAEGIFLSRPAGSRCLWSINWTTSSGPLSPNQYAPLTSLSDVQLAFEAQDVASRGFMSRDLGSLAFDFSVGAVRNPASWRSKLVSILGEARGGSGYSEATWPYSPPLFRGNDEFGHGRLVRLVLRDGWGSKSEVMARAGG